MKKDSRYKSPSSPVKIDRIENSALKTASNFKNATPKL